MFSHDLTYGIDLLCCEIAGTSHHCDEDTGRQVALAETLALLREPENPYDHDAIAVLLADRKVGYIPRRHNAVLARLMDAGKHLRARVERVPDPDAGLGFNARVVVELRS